MKITDVVVYEVKPRWIFVKVCTDEGIEGWGEMISGTKTETVVAGAKEMGAYLMGRNPLEIMAGNVQIFLQRWSNQWYDCIWI